MRSAGVRSGPTLAVMAACFGKGPERDWLTDLAMADDSVSLTFVQHRVALIRRAQALRPSVVVLPVRDARGVPSAPLIERLREDLPWIRVLVLLNPSATRAGLAEAIRAGGEPAIIGKPSELRSALGRIDSEGRQSAREYAATRALVSSLQPAELQSILLFCVAQAHRGLLVRDIAAARRVSARTLGRRLAVAGWPGTVELIGWGSLLRASILQWCEASSVSALVQASGFSSVRAMQHTADELFQRAIQCPRDLSPLLVTWHLRHRMLRLAATTRR